MAKADHMTAGELKRMIERAAQLGLTQVHAVLVAKLNSKRRPAISVVDGSSEGLRDDLAKTLLEIENLIGPRNYVRQSLRARGCKGAVARIVAGNAPSARQTLDCLAKAGRLDLAFEHLIVRYPAEFDPELVARAARNLDEVARPSDRQLGARNELA
ncbi:MAG: hypothetical protein M3Z31_12800 [Pseudomonadota bacterium]|nr:hypothetical protein [Pseudomonadota bacterium]